MSEWPSVLLVGGGGVIGRVLADGWQGRCDVFDLPDGDARDRAALTAAALGYDALVHLAWDGQAENFRNGGFAPQNLAMAVNAVEAACIAGVGRVVLASSVHADAFPPRATPLRADGHCPIPDSPYGASKVFMEALGRYAAAHRGLDVVAVRFGGVNPRDRQPESASERAVWLRHEDCVSLVHAATTAPLGATRYALAVGVSDHADRVHAVAAGALLEWTPATRADL